MNFQAFDMMRDALGEELEKQGFYPAQPLEEETGQAVMYATDEVAYSLLYDRKKQRFELRSTTLKEPGVPGDWRSLSLWLFDEEDGTRADAESILSDFLEVVRGPKRVAIVQQKKKRGKDDERNIDPLFFYNRLANMFPELKDEMNNERIVYGQIRFVTFAKEHIVPKIEDMAIKYSQSDSFEKLCALFDDMYKSGDMDLRSILTITIVNNMSDAAFENLRNKLGDELKRSLKLTRKLRGKNIQPEKKKKEKKVVAKPLGR